MAVAEAPRTAAGYVSETVSTTYGVGFTDQSETVPDLIWPQSVTTYARMRTDPQIAAVLSAYTLPLRQAGWAVDPAGCRAEVAKLVADDLGLPLLGQDEPGPARRRGIRWPDHLRVALLQLVYGHSPFAQRFEIIGGQARLAELSERLPTTITEILVDRDGHLLGIQQHGSDLIIPADHLTWYAHEREGAAWQGRSLLRPAYSPWLLKHEMWRVHATSNRRFGMGVPTVTAPPGGTPAQLAEAQQIASSIRAGELAGAGLPAGFALQLAGYTGSVPDTLGWIRYLDAQIAAMALAGLLNLDAAPHGSRALGTVWVDLMLTALNAIAADVASTATGLSVQMVDYNWGTDEPAPRVTVTDVGSRPEVTAEALQLLLNAGAIHPDPELEAWVRERWSLPERTTPIPAPPPIPALPPGSPAPAADGGGSPAPESANTSAGGGPP